MQVMLSNTSCIIWWLHVRPTDCFLTSELIHYSSRLHPSLQAKCSEMEYVYNTTTLLGPCSPWKPIRPGSHVTYFCMVLAYYLRKKEGSQRGYLSGESGGLSAAPVSSVLIVPDFPDPLHPTG